MSLSDKTFNLALNYPEIIRNEKYKELLNIQRHIYTNTYDHSLRVARLSGYIAKKLGADPESAMKVGLLHDFCLINRHDGSYTGDESYLFKHPKDAVENSKPFSLSKVEEKAILTHMFPLAPIPTSRIGWSLTIADKIVAIYEQMHVLTSFSKVFSYRTKMPNTKFHIWKFQTY